MVISTDLKDDFFDKIIGKQILIIAANGVDSVCTFNIIKRIFKNHEVPFSYSIITNKSELQITFLKYGKIDNVLLINCGSLFDVIEFLEINDNDSRVIYILDSQRPIHVNNFYNSTQVKILTLQEQFDYVPEFEDIFSNEDEIEDSDSDNDSYNSAKRTKFDANFLEEKIRQREWKKKRGEIMDFYEKYSFHGTSSSLVAYHLSTLIHQDSLELLWSAIVGHTSQLLMNFINRDSYCNLLNLLQSYLSKLVSERKESRKNNLSEINIRFTDELSLWLYRHWTLKEAIYCTPVTLTNFQLYKISDKKLREFLAILGIPQIEFEAKFSSMKYELRNEIDSLFQTHCQKFNLQKDDLFLPSFVASCGFRVELSAIDVTFIIAALLDFKILNNKEEINDTFLNAVNFLSINDVYLIETGLEMAKEYIETMNKFTKSILESGDVNVCGTFLQVIVKKTAPLLLSAPLMQYFLSRYLLEATCSQRPKLGKLRKTQLLPLIIYSEHRTDDYLILYGIPPLKSDKSKNPFGQIFEDTLVSVKSRIQQDSFDICKMKINAADISKVVQIIRRFLSE